MKRALLALVLLLTVACGGEGDETSEGETATETTSPSEVTAPAGVNVGATQTRSAEQTEIAELRSASTVASEEEPTEVSEPTNTPRPTATSVPPTATPDIANVGDTIEWDDGSRITLHQVERPTTPLAFRDTDEGKEWMALDLEQCAPPSIPAGQTVTANSINWVLTMPDNTQVQAEPGAKEPSIVVAKLLSGECVRGWVTYQVPLESTPTGIAFTGYTYDFDQFFGRWELQ